jgi:hypothetical protein
MADGSEYYLSVANLRAHITEEETFKPSVSTIGIGRGCFEDCFREVGSPPPYTPLLNFGRWLPLPAVAIIFRYSCFIDTPRSGIFTVVVGNIAVAVGTVAVVLAAVLAVGLAVDLHFRSAADAGAWVP